MCSSDEGAPGEMTGSSEQSPRALLDGGNGRIGKDLLGDSADFEMVVEVAVHVLSCDTLEVAAGNDSRCQGDGSPVEQEIDQIVLAGQDDGQVRFGVALELGEGMELGIDFDP